MIKEENKNKNSTLGTISLIFGILGLIFCWVPAFGIILAIVAIITGGIGFKKEEKFGLSLAGLILGLLSFAIGLILLITTLALFGVASDLISEDSGDNNGIISLETSDSSSNSISTTTIPTTTTPSKSWHDLTSFSGSGDKNTDTFNIQGSKFKLIYIVKGDNDYALLTLSVYEEDSSFPTEMIMTDIGFTGSEETIIYDGSGTYYLDIGAANLHSWSVKVEDYY